MSFEFRPATQADVPQFGELTAYAYAGAFGDGDDNLAMQSNRPEWTLCAFDGTKMVASYGTIPFTMRGNGNAMSLGGVTTVATAPEYRRRGLLRAITTRALEQQREAGQSVAALWASQAAIYQRYGYALGSVLGTYEIDTVDLNLLEPPGEDVEVQRVPVAEAFDIVKATYRAFAAERMLYLHRSAPLWQANVLSEDAQSGPVHVALCTDKSSNTRGYVAYTLRSAKVAHAARAQEIEIRDLVWLDIDACRALWSFIARHDLVGRVTWSTAPLDDPLPELLVEPRMLHARQREGVWFRVVDTAAACAARGYDTDGELVFRVAEDSLTPWNAGSFRLTVSNGVADVTPSSAAPDVEFTTRTLSSAFCGFRRVGALAGWGLVSGTPDGIARADALFATRFAPHCPDHF